jgi:hypothetical protein
MSRPPELAGEEPLDETARSGVGQPIPHEFGEEPMDETAREPAQRGERKAVAAMEAPSGEVVLRVLHRGEEDQCREQGAGATRARRAGAGRCTAMEASATAAARRGPLAWVAARVPILASERNGRGTRESPSSRVNAMAVRVPVLAWDCWLPCCFLVEGKVLGSDDFVVCIPGSHSVLACVEGARNREREET